MDFQVLILDYILTERAGMILLLSALIFYVFQQNKTLNTIEKELSSVRDKINKLVNRTDDTTSDLSSLNSRISNLSGAVSEATTVAEGTKKELNMLAEGINSETVFNEAIDLARKGSSADDIVTQTKLCLLYTSPSPRDATLSRMPSSA